LGFVRVRWKFLFRAAAARFFGRAQPPMPTGHTGRRARVSAQANKSICKFVLSAQAGAKRAGKGAKARGWKQKPTNGALGGGRSDHERHEGESDLAELHFCGCSIGWGEGSRGWRVRRGGEGKMRA
jgi:hypothetical protein